MSEKIVSAQADGDLQGAACTAASRLLSTTDIWSDVPSPLVAPAPASVPPPSREPDLILEARTPVEIVAVAPTITHDRTPRQWPPQKLSLALQGGGTFAAFTWGVLERLLEEPSIAIDTISGASAGAINALLLAS